MIVAIILPFVVVGLFLLVFRAAYWWTFERKSVQKMDEESVDAENKDA